ncbi:MAG TPA: phosphoribosylamine--glycine ligase [Bacillota bacterium]|nr:phosphoribosylamine--glycine ligase [Bacillota bacterium]HPT87500.1 phosphoribosylamine--glycine ligase [Bacillota bacterium]
MKVLIIGNGGREHAIAWKLAQSPQVSKIYCSPGNGGTAAIAENISFQNIHVLTEFAINHGIDLTVVGPEAYLADGIVDVFQKAGLCVYGPTKLAARLESSKAFSKAFMKKYNIPTAKFESFSDAESAKAYIRQVGAPIVVKADGLAAGKGVVVAFDVETALKAVDDMMTAKIFGESGATVVIEEYLEGEEASLLAFCDGNIGIPMIPAQDHKRIGDGDTGPNTGGMGTYAPTSAVTPDVMERIVNEILNPTLKAMALEGTPFVGTLFLGLMLTKTGPKVIEYNVRFGDPETQVVLPLLDSDLAQVFKDAANGCLDPKSVRWKQDQVAVCVVLASGGYPGAYQTGITIDGLDTIQNSLVFHAGTKQTADQGLVTAGGRVLNIVHVGENIQSAIEGVYADVEKVHFEGMIYRKDIARRELNRYIKK